MPQRLVGQDEAELCLGADAVREDDDLPVTERVAHCVDGVEVPGTLSGGCGVQLGVSSLEVRLVAEDVDLGLAQQLRDEAGHGELYPAQIQCLGDGLAIEVDEVAPVDPRLEGVDLGLGLRGLGRFTEHGFALGLGLSRGCGSVDPQLAVDDLGVGVALSVEVRGHRPSGLVQEVLGTFGNHLLPEATQLLCPLLLGSGVELDATAGVQLVDRIGQCLGGVFLLIGLGDLGSLDLVQVLDRVVREVELTQDASVEELLHLLRGEQTEDHAQLAKPLDHPRCVQSIGVPRMRQASSTCAGLGLLGPGLPRFSLGQQREGITDRLDLVVVEVPLRLPLLEELDCLFLLRSGVPIGCLVRHRDDQRDHVVGLEQVDLSRFHGCFSRSHGVVEPLRIRLEVPTCTDRLQDGDLCRARLVGPNPAYLGFLGQVDVRHIPGQPLRVPLVLGGQLHRHRWRLGGGLGSSGCGLLAQRHDREVAVNRDHHLLHRHAVLCIPGEHTLLRDLSSGRTLALFEQPLNALRQRTQPLHQRLGFCRCLGYLPGAPGVSLDVFLGEVVLTLGILDELVVLLLGLEGFVLKVLLGLSTSLHRGVLQDRHGLGRLGCQAIALVLLGTRGDVVSLEDQDGVTLARERLTIGAEADVGTRAQPVLHDAGDVRITADSVVDVLRRVEEATVSGLSRFALLACLTECSPSPGAYTPLKLEPRPKLLGEVIHGSGQPATPELPIHINRGLGLALWVDDEVHHPDGFPRAVQGDNRVLIVPVAQQHQLYLGAVLESHTLTFALPQWCLGCYLLIAACKIDRYELVALEGSGCRRRRGWRWRRYRRLTFWGGGFLLGWGRCRRLELLALGTLGFLRLRCLEGLLRLRRRGWLRGGSSLLRLEPCHRVRSADLHATCRSCRTFLDRISPGLSRLLAQRIPLAHVRGAAILPCGLGRFHGERLSHTGQRKLLRDYPHRS